MQTYAVTMSLRGRPMRPPALDLHAAVGPASAARLRPEALRGGGEGVRGGGESVAEVARRRELGLPTVADASATIRF